MKEKHCPTHFLSDEPVENDNFGTHEKVAKALLELICNGNSDTVHSIALEGAWGSGKSTVIKILKRLIQQEQCNEDIAVFVYDAWAHQGDSLRRSFMEKLIDFLIDRGWINKENWEEEKARLSRRLEETNITTTPQLTSWGKALALSLGLVPVGMAIATMGGNVSTFFRYIGVSLTIVPILVVFAAIIRNKFSKRKDESALLIFLNRTKEIQRTRTIRTPDPTTVEFAEKYKKLLKEALGNEGKLRKLIIVMDNLDRLPPQEALLVWATMRTFTLFESEEEWQSRLFLLVPFAPEALSKLWEDSEKSSTVQAFIEKTFQLRLQVPPPVLSDWNEFLRTQLEQAFPQHEKPEIDTIIRLFRLKGIPENRPLTPRDIKLFVNKVGALHLKWKNTIPLPIQAAYVLYKKGNYQEFRKNLIEGKLLDERAKIILQKTDWQKDFASLYFNVPPDKALQVLVGQQVEKALTEGDSKGLEKYKDIPGLVNVIEEIMDRNLVEWSSQPEIPARIPLALENIVLEDKVWESIRRMLEKTNKSFKHFGAKVGEGLKVLIQKYRDQELAKHVLYLIKETLSQIANEENETQKYQKVQSWVQGSYIIIQELLNQGMDDVVRSFEVPGEASLYIEVMRALTKENPEKETVKCFVPSIDGERIIDTLINSINQKALFEGWGHAVGLMIEIGPEWPWIKLVNSANRITNSQLLPPEQWKEILQALWHIYFLEKSGEGHFKARQTLEQMAKDGRVFHYLYVSYYQNKKWIDSSWNLMTLISFNPEGQSQRPWNSSSTGRQIFHQILQNPENYGQMLSAFAHLARKYLSFEELLGIYNKHANTKKWIEAAMEKILDEHPNFFEPVVITNNYEIFQTFPSELQRKIVQKIKGNLIAHLKSIDFSINLSKLYLQILEGEDQPPPDFVNFLKKGLKTVDDDQWIESFKSHDSLFQLLIYLLKMSESLNLGQSLADALRKWTKFQINGEGEFTEQQLEEFSILPDALTKGFREIFWKNLRDILIENADKADKDLSKVLLIFGTGLITSGVFKEKADEIVRRLFSEIIERGSEVELQWMLQVFEEVPGFLQEVPTSSLEDLKERLEKANELPESITPKIEELKDKIAHEIERRSRT